MNGFQFDSHARCRIVLRHVLLCQDPYKSSILFWAVFFLWALLAVTPTRILVLSAGLVSEVVVSASLLHPPCSNSVDLLYRVCTPQLFHRSMAT